VKWRYLSINPEKQSNLMPQGKLTNETDFQQFSFKAENNLKAVQV
jgi:hypothetical protein